MNTLPSPVAPVLGGAEIGKTASNSAGEGTLLISCAWCGVHLGTAPCSAELHGKPSHGICDHCTEKHFGLNMKDLTDHDREALKPLSIRLIEAGQRRRVCNDCGQTTPSNAGMCEVCGEKFEINQEESKD